MWEVAEPLNYTPCHIPALWIYSLAEEAKKCKMRWLTMGGRAKGTPNKDKDAIIKMLRKANPNGVDPLIILDGIANGQGFRRPVWQNPTDAVGQPGEPNYQPAFSGGFIEVLEYPDIKLRKDAATEVCQYIHAKRKAVEVTGEINHGAQVHYHMPGTATNMEEWGALVGLAQAGEVDP
jgi:hypothetical protein